MLLRTLGGLELTGTGFTRPKPLLLLAYLALEGSRERRHLAELFFPDARDPLNRVAVAFTRLRKAGPGLVETSATTAWTAVATDAGQLLACARRGEHGAAIESYRGPFVDGIPAAGWSAELEEWVHATREFLAARVAAAHLALAEADAGTGDFRRAAERAAAGWKIVRLTGLEPDDLRRVHTLLLAADHPEANRVQDEAKDFGFELATTIDEARAELRSLTRASTNLRGDASGFVGRRRELARLAELLGSPDARLITVVGGGGVGKTRLAVRAAQQQLERDAFPGGIYFVALDALSASAAVPAKLAEALGIDPKRAEPLRRVARRIGDARTLLVLDNFEHLLDGAPLLTELLRDCPGLTLLATSRERLNLAGEWLFPLAGLSSPPAEDSGGSDDRGAGGRGAGDRDAVALFLLRARQVVPGFSPSPAALRGIERICRFLEGSPLAIELAAALLRILPPSTLAEELQRDPDVLSSPVRDAPARHRSVRAVFEHSWGLCTPEERAALRKLAVFRGGFTRRAAAEVAGATIPLLASLVDKSLLRASERGRYDRHPLIYHYTREKLEFHPDEARAAAAAHAAHFARFSAGLRLEFNGPHPRHAMERLAAEFENCRVAWNRALAERDAGQLRELVNAVWFRFGNWHPGSEVIGFWEAAAAALDADDPDHRETLGVMYSLQAQYRGDDALAARGLELLGSRGDRLGRGICLGILAYNAQLDGRFDAAFEYMRRHQEVVVSDLRGEHIAGVADLEMDQGRYEAAKERLLEALSVGRSAQATRTVVAIHYQLGSVHLLMGGLDAAQRHYREGLELARARGFQPGGKQEPEGLVGLARVALARGDPERAFELASEALSREERANEAKIGAFVVLGRVATARGEHERAEHRFRQATATLGGLSSERRAADVLAPGILLAWSELRIAQGRIDAATAMLAHLLATTPAAYHREAARELLERLGLPEAERRRTRFTGGRLRLEEVIALAN